MTFRQLFVYYQVSIFRINININHIYRKADNGVKSVKLYLKNMENFFCLENSNNRRTKEKQMIKNLLRIESDCDVSTALRILSSSIFRINININHIYRKRGNGLKSVKLYFKNMEKFFCLENNNKRYVNENNDCLYRILTRIESDCDVSTALRILSSLIFRIKMNINYIHRKRANGIKTVDLYLKNMEQFFCLENSNKRRTKEIND